MYTKSIDNFNKIEELKVKYEAKKNIYDNLPETEEVNDKYKRALKYEITDIGFNYRNLVRKQRKFYKKNKENILMDLKNEPLNKQKDFIEKQKNVIKENHEYEYDGLKFMLKKFVPTCLVGGVAIHLITGQIVMASLGYTAFALSGTMYLSATIYEKIAGDKELKDIQNVEDQIDGEIINNKEKNYESPLEEYSNVVELKNYKQIDKNKQIDNELE